MNFQHYLLALEISAFLCGLAAFRFARPRGLRLVILLCGLTVLNELLVIPEIISTGAMSRTVVYNLYSFIEMSVWFYFFYFTESALGKKTILALVFLAFIAGGIEVWINSWSIFRVYSFRLYNLCIVAMALAWYYHVSRKAHYTMTRDAMFWLVTGVFFYNLLLFINVTTMAEIGYWTEREARQIFSILHGVGNSFYYLLLCYAFIILIYYGRKPAASSQNSSR